jgi:hypothetical protein
MEPYTASFGIGRGSLPKKIIQKAIPPVAASATKQYYTHLKDEFSVPVALPPKKCLSVPESRIFTTVGNPSASVEVAVNILDACKSALGNFSILKALLRFEEKAKLIEGSTAVLSSDLQSKIKKILEEVKIEFPTPYCALYGCRKAAVVTCPICIATKYCSVEHKEDHFITHDPICREYVAAQITSLKTKNKLLRQAPKKYCSCKHKACLTYCLYFGKPKFNFGRTNLPSISGDVLDKICS